MFNSLPAGARRLASTCALLAALLLAACGGGSTPDTGDSTAQPPLPAALRTFRQVQTNLAAASDPNALFDWAERVYPQFFPSHRDTTSTDGLSFRYYPESGNYVGLAGGSTLGILVPAISAEVILLGDVSQFNCLVNPIICGLAAPGLTGAAAVPLNVMTQGSDASLLMGSTLVGETESLLALSGLAEDVARKYQTSAAPMRADRYCWNNLGHLDLNLQDADRNGRLSVGDTLLVAISQCSISLLGDEVDGTLTLNVLPGTDLPNGVLNVVVSTARLSYAGRLPNQGRPGPLVVSGAFHLIRLFPLTTFSRITLITSTGADDWTSTLTLNGRSYKSALTSLNIAKQTDLNGPRNDVRLAFNYQSEYLGGSVQLATDSPLGGYPNEYPSSGALRITGAEGAQVLLIPYETGAPGADDYRLGGATMANYAISLPNANGTRTNYTTRWRNASRSVLWLPEGSTIEGVQGYLFDYGLAPANYRLEPSNEDLTLRLPVTTTIVMRFTRDMSLVPHVKLRFVGDYWDGPYLKQNITEALLTRTGAVWKVKPTTPLQWNAHYRLEWAYDGGPFQSIGDLKDSAGTHLMWLSLDWLSFYTQDDLRPAFSANALAILSPSESITLDARGSVGEFSPIVSYQWSYSPGWSPSLNYPLSINAPNSPVTQVRWGSATPPVPGGQVSITLTITDGRGQKRTLGKDFYVGDLTTAHSSIYIHDSPQYIQYDGDAFYTDQDGEFTIGNFDDIINFGGVTNGIKIRTARFDLMLYATGNQPLAVGSYSDALGTYLPNLAANGLQLSNLHCIASDTRGSFTILQLERDSSGQVQKLAVDFETSCYGWQQPRQGSVRFNSAMPLRR